MRPLALVLVAFLSVPALAADAGPSAPADAAPLPVPRRAAETVLDFGDEEAMGLGEVMAVEDPTPKEHRSLMPARYAGLLDAGPSPAHPGSVEERGCAGCRAGAGGGGVGLGMVLGALGWLAWSGRRGRWRER